MLEAGRDYDAHPIAWREAGPPDGEVILFLHGLGTTRTGWEPQLADLADTWRCVAWDMPGYGASAHPTEPLTFASIADAAADLLDTLGVDAAHIVGLSFGGMHALHLALRHPERVQTLTLADSSPAFGSDGVTTRDDWVRARLEAIDAGASPADIAPAVMRAIGGPDFSGEAFEAAVASMSRIDADGLRAAVHLLPDHDVRDHLDAISAPTLVIVGELDEETPPSYARVLATQIPDARLVEIPRAGHLTPLEAPATFNAHVRSFLSERTA